jgi:hypothetical protein
VTTKTVTERAIGAASRRTLSVHRYDLGRRSRALITNDPAQGYRAQRPRCHLVLPRCFRAETGADRATQRKSRLDVPNYTILKSAGGGNRTRTAVTRQGILSPLCLPISPPRRKWDGL